MEPVRVVWSSGRFIEGADGAAGFQWLLLFPVIVLAFTRRRPLAQWLCLALAALISSSASTAAVVHALPAARRSRSSRCWAAGHSTDDSGRHVPPRIAMLVVGALLCAVNVRLMYTGSLVQFHAVHGVRHRRPRQARIHRAVRAGPDRRRLPQPESAARARRLLHAGRARPPASSAIPAPPTGTTIRHSRALATAQTADDVLAHARKFGLTHIVYRDPP